MELRYPEGWINYLRTGYYGMYQKHWIKYYLDDHYHLGELTSSRTESNHANLKLYITNGRSSDLPGLINATNQAIQVIK
jgi:hypothetical protein